MKEHFTQEIIHLKRHLAQQTATAETALSRALRAITTLDTKLAHEVVENDFAIDCEEIRIEEDCLKILALYQPVATDLRTIVTVLKINVEIERVADMAANIAQRTMSLSVTGVPAGNRIDFSKMASAATRMLKDALDSFAYRDPAAAASIIARDTEVDEMLAEYIGLICKNVAADPEHADYYLSCMTIAKNLERVADVATNICEDVIYLERGKIVRHSHGA